MIQCNSSLVSVNCSCAILH